MQWYDWHTVTERLQGRAYALTRGCPYKVILDPATSTGTCDFTNKRIHINPNLFSDALKKMGLIDTSLDKANFLISRAVTCHEALHVLYSDPQVVMATVGNPHLKIVLNLLEDARIEKIGSQSSHVSKILFRFVNGIAANQLTPLKDTKLKNFRSWISLLLRWRLSAELPTLSKDAAIKWDQVQILAQKSLFAVTCAEVLEYARQIVDLIGLNGADSADLDSKEPMLGRMQSGMSGSRASQPYQNPLKSDDTKSAGESGQSGVTPDNSNSCNKKSDENSPANKDVGKLVHLVHSPLSKDDLERLVEDTAMQVSEDLESLVPQDSPNSSTVAKAKPWRGRVYPDIYSSPYIHYLPTAVPIAAELIRELKTQSPRATSGASDSAGKFKTRYFIRDGAKPYAAERFQGLATPKMALSLIIDRSGSMESVQEELRVMSMSIAMACEQLGIPLSIWALEGQVHIKGFDEHGPQVLAKLAGIEADTLTRVMPTIRDAVTDLKQRPEALKQIVMIHDGMPGDRGDFMNWRKELRGIGLFCLYIMPEDEYQLQKDNPTSLRENMDDLVGPKNYAIAPVTGIAKHWCSYIKNVRNRNSIPVQ